MGELVGRTIDTNTINYTINKKSVFSTQQYYIYTQNLPSNQLESLIDKKT